MALQRRFLSAVELPLPSQSLRRCSLACEQKVIMPDISGEIFVERLYLLEVTRVKRVERETSGCGLLRLRPGPNCGPGEIAASGIGSSGVEELCS